MLCECWIPLSHPIPNAIKPDEAPPRSKKIRRWRAYERLERIACKGAPNRLKDRHPIDCAMQVDFAP